MIHVGPLPILFTFRSAPVLPKRILVEQIKRKVAFHYNVPVLSMVNRQNEREYARPRQVAMTLARLLTPMSLPEIGKRFGNRDHTTILHAVRQIQQLRAEDPELDADMREIAAALGGRL